MTFQEENDIYLKTLLNERFFKIWKEPNNIFDTHDINNCTCLEVYLTSHCNQKCEYCYLYNNNGKIYPKDKDNEENILHNFSILLEWLGRKNYYINTFDIFSGEIWHTQFGIKILEMVLQAVKTNLHIYNIMIATNGFFVLNDKITEQIQYYIDEFAKHNIKLTFSFSIDGKVIDNQTRPRNNTPYTDEFYNKLFIFAKKNGYYFHPMVAAFGIELWIDNFKWWEEMAKQYGLKIFDILMLLEVRNDNWTQDKIKSYTKFIEFLYEWYKNLFPTIEDFTKSYFFFPSRNKDFDIKDYWPLFLTEEYNIKTCTIGTHLTIRVGDLAIVPCHRTAYDKFVYGYFQVENNKIVDIKSNNIQVANRIIMTNDLQASPKCDCCFYSYYCMRGCFGAQYESNNDLFVVNETVCNLYKAKINKLIELNTKYKVWDILAKIPTVDPMYERIQKHLEFVKGVKKLNERLGNT